MSRNWMKGLLAGVALTAVAACGDAPKPQAGLPNLAPGCTLISNGQVICRDTPPPAAPQERVVREQMEQGGSGTYYVNVGIADKCCFRMVLDTGASDVSVPSDLWYAMLKGGAITEADHIDVVRYRTANGVVEGLRFRMPPMTIGGITVHNVIGSVSKNSRGQSILLGQSFLQKFKAWSINNATGQLVLAY